MKAHHWWIFFAGWLCHAAGDMFYQDLLGRDRFMAMVYEGWLNTPLWFDAALFVLAVTVASHEARKHP